MKQHKPLEERVLLKAEYLYKEFLAEHGINYDEVLPSEEKFIWWSFLDEYRKNLKKIFPDFQPSNDDNCLKALLGTASHLSFYLAQTAEIIAFIITERTCVQPTQKTKSFMDVFFGDTVIEKAVRFLAGREALAGGYYLIITLKKPTYIDFDDAHSELIEKMYVFDRGGGIVIEDKEEKPIKILGKIEDNKELIEKLMEFFKDQIGEPDEYIENISLG